MTLPTATELLGPPEVDGVGVATTAASPFQPGVAAAIAPDSPATPSDEHLLARFLKGDREALGALASRHEPQLLGLACALTGRRDLALESVQDTWLRVIKYGRSFRSGSSVKTWLYRILINACKDARTKNSRFRFASTTSARGGTGGLPTGDVATTSSNLSDSPDLALLRTTIDTLSGDQKLLILLCYHNGLSHPQAAEVLDIPVGTLKSRLHTTLTTLRTHLKEPLA
jgi:RNA polymerase sigma-70 factor (ECF subfamily)